MARIRTVKPDFFTSEDIMALSPLARLLYIGTWLEADREGRLTWKPATLKVRYLPHDPCDVSALAAELVDRGLIVPYGAGLAFIPSFKDHQFINGKEPSSKLPAPDQMVIDTCRTRAGRVQDAPSFPSYSPSFPFLPKMQGSGAFEPGSLPRDHKHHVLCGALMQVCLRDWEYRVLAKAYNEADEIKTRVVIVQFLEVLEKGITPNASIGPFSWVEKEFHTYMKSIGRVPAKLDARPKFSVDEALKKREAGLA